MTTTITSQDLQAKFQGCLWGKKADHFLSPGRLIWIGEHTDYNGGHVPVAAITLALTERKKACEDVHVSSQEIFEDKGTGST